MPAKSHNFSHLRGQSRSLLLLRATPLSCLETSRVHSEHNGHTLIMNQLLNIREGNKKCLCAASL